MCVPNDCSNTIPVKFRRSCGKQEWHHVRTSRWNFQSFPQCVQFTGLLRYRSHWGTATGLIPNYSLQIELETVWIANDRMSGGHGAWSKPDEVGLQYFPVHLMTYHDFMQAKTPDFSTFSMAIQSTEQAVLQVSSLGCKMKLFELALFPAWDAFWPVASHECWRCP